MTYKEYEIIVEKLEERLDSGLITESTAEAINSYCYDKYMEAYVDEMCDALEDEYDESTRLSRELHNEYKNDIKKLEDKKSKVDRQIASLEELYKTAKEGSNSKKAIEEKIKSLRNTSESIEAGIRGRERRRKENDTIHAGKSTFKTDPKYGISQGELAKKSIRKNFDAYPAAAPRKPGLYKKIHDNK